MLPSLLNIDDFLQHRNTISLVDVRSEAEFEHAHIPGAINIPLLNNEQRKTVGTLYKQKGREAAVIAGYEFAGPRFAELFQTFLQLSKQKPVVFYCWRGGLRSQICQTILQWGGGYSGRINGGYKSYRKAVLQGFSKPLNYIVLSGLTGTGKTEILEILSQKGEQIVDLEKLAHHKGSALGALGMPPQNSNEMFENTLFDELVAMDASKPVFVENESRKIGSNVLPEIFWDSLSAATVIEIETDKPQRLKRIMHEYGHFNTDDLAFCTEKIKKRLGGLALKNALDALYAGNKEEWALILMDYYDRTYTHGREQRGQNGTALHWDWENQNESLLHLLKTAYESSK